MVIFAATKGLLTDIPTPRLQEWVASFVHFVHEKQPAIVDGIRDTKALSDDNTKALTNAITEFNKSF
jgi:F-type H+-transporting ATPase subunit alpha